MRGPGLIHSCGRNTSSQWQITPKSPQVRASARPWSFEPASIDRTRALDIVTVTDIVWDVVTVTEYDLPSEATTSVEVAETQVAAQTTSTTSAAAIVAPEAAVAPAVSTSAVDVAQSTTPTVQISAPVPTTTSESAPATQAVAQEPADTTVAVAVASSPAAAVVETPATTTTTPIAETPTTTSTTPVAETPTTTLTTPAAAAATTSSATSTTTTGEYSGDGTYYELGLTACGETYTDSDYVAAISYLLFDQDGTANPNSKCTPLFDKLMLTISDNPHCGKKIRVFYETESVDVTIVDRCAGCEKTYSVDLSPVAFQQLAPESAGRIAITWSYI